MDDTLTKMRAVLVRNPGNFHPNNQFDIPNYPHNVRQHALNTPFKNSPLYHALALRLKALRQQQQPLYPVTTIPSGMQSQAGQQSLLSQLLFSKQSLPFIPSSQFEEKYPMTPLVPSRGPLSWLLKSRSGSNNGITQSRAVIGRKGIIQHNEGHPFSDSSLTSLPPKTLLPLHTLLQKNNSINKPSAQTLGHQEFPSLVQESLSGHRSRNHLQDVSPRIRVPSPSVTFVQKLPDIQPYSDVQTPSLQTSSVSLSSTPSLTSSSSHPYLPLLSLTLVSKPSLTSSTQQPTNDQVNDMKRL